MERTLTPEHTSVLGTVPLQQLDLSGRAARRERFTTQLSKVESERR